MAPSGQLKSQRRGHPADRQGMGIILPAAAFKSDAECFEFMAGVSGRVEAGRG